MKIYGVALLAFCFVVGKLIGSYLGSLIGVNSDVGGVGFAMVLLMVGNIYLRKKDLLGDETKSGILFWSSMYIPVVIAMCASQNVRAAVSGGPAAILAGAGVTIACLFMVPLISKIGINKESQEKN